ncbi:Vomp family autotransporter [Bartonella sp. AP72JLCBS]|uniref:Vomp family autotransporter n=1 Tax=Bartonella sp. AP72JLCBS TaxID=3243502 RepID=UPI0035CFEB1E
MKKKYSTPNLIKVVSLSTVMATLLSSVSPVVASNLAITGDKTMSTSGSGVSYDHGSHGSIVFAGDDNYCGVDNVIGRGGKQQESIASTNQITAEQQYDRFIKNTNFSGRYPYGVTTDKVTWSGDSNTSNSSTGYMGKLTGGSTSAMPEAYGVYSFATGCGSAATGNYSTAFGAGATAKSGGAQAFGVSALANGAASVAIGIGSETVKRSSIAIGGLSKADGIDSIAFGSSAATGGQDAIAIGYAAKAGAQNAVSVGSSTKATGKSSLALGYKASASGELAVAIGGLATGIHGIAMGNNAEAKDQDTIAIGYAAQAQTKYSIAIGPNAQVIAGDGVALGGASVASVVNNVAGYDPVSNKNSQQNNGAWKSTKSAISVGKADGSITRQITGLAAGTADTDAVNVAQLKAMRAVVEGAGGWKLSVNGEAAVDILPGETVNFAGAELENYENKNIKIVRKDDKTVEFDLNDFITVGRVQAGKTQLSDLGFVITGGPRMTGSGIFAGNKQVYGVAAGSAETDAVNVAQLNDVKELISKAGGSWKLSVDGNNATDVGAGSTVDIVAAVSGDGSKNIKIEKDNNKVTFSLNDTLKLTSVTTGNSIMNSEGFIIENGPRMILDGISAGNKKITDVAAGKSDTDAVNYAQLSEVRQLVSKAGGWKLSVNGEAAVDILPGETVNFAGAELENYENKNIKIVRKDDKTVEFDLNDFITVGRVQAGKTQLSDLGFVITGGPRMTGSGIFAGNKQVYGVAAGSAETDAVNVAQLNEVKNQIAGNGLVKWDEEQKLITIGKEKDGTKIDVAGSGGDRSISGVKAAERDNEAVNKKQLDGEIATITDTINNIKEGGAFAVLYDKNGDSSVNYNSVTLGGGKTGGQVALHNVKDGEITEESYDAINGRQLWKTNERVTDVEKDIVHINDKVTNISATVTDLGKEVFNIQEANAFAVLYDKNADETVNYNSVTLGGGKSTGPVALLNVKDGKIAKDSHDAINGNQINTISGDIAKFFGGGTVFQDGSFLGPRYNLSTVSADGTVGQKVHTDVGSALTGLDDNVNNVNSRLTHVANEFTQKIEGVSKDSLLWSNDEQAFVAQHGDGKTNSKIKFLSNGDITENSTDAVNGSQLFATNQNVNTVTNNLTTIAKNISKYFGGGADVSNGKAPTYTIQGKPHNDFESAFSTVDNSITNIQNQITNATKNSLVKQEENEGTITVGKATGGTKINVANKSGDARTISGVKAAERNDEAVNKAQLDKSIEKISNDINLTSAAAVLYDKENGTVNYGSVTLGGVDNQGPVALHNVKDGKIAEDSHDAINGNQINKISGDIANYFGGGASFENGAFKGPNYSLSVIVEDGQVAKANYHDVGSALSGLDANVKSVNTHLTNVVKDVNEKITNITQEVKGDALLWSNDEQAFVALHGEGQKTNSKLTSLLNGDISEDSTDAVNGSQLYETNQKISKLGNGFDGISTNISKYFGGDTDIANGKAPTYTIQGTTHNDVSSAFSSVNNSITEISNQISNATKNSLVKQEENEGDITIGKEKGGTKIDITGSGGARTIAGVKAAENDNEAVNKKQLDESIGKINNNIENISASAVLYDKNDDSTVNYESVTLGGNKVNGQVALHNVKDGEISDQSHDAINGSQINKISQNVAEFFGGGTSFENGVFRKPRYNLTTIDENGQVKQREYNDVGLALSGLDTNIRHVNHHLVLSMKDVASYFGGGAGYDENGEWYAPTFVVSQRNEDGTIVEKKHHNVADAFKGVDNSITDIYNQINNVTENSLVKQEGGSEGLITVGKATGGTKISIANKDNQERTLSGIKDGELSQTSTEAVNGSQLFATNEKVTTVNNDLKTVAQNTSKYFGGSTDVLNGIEPAFLIQGETYHNVTEAFTGVNTSITNIDNKISEVVKNSLVKQEKNTDVITIGKDTAGTEINIAGYAGVARSISGVKAAEKGDEAVNKDQLDKSIKDITKDIETVTAAAVLYDKNDDNSVNYGSVTLGGDKNNGPVALHNVKDGSISENSNDAINGSQINKISADIAKFFGGGAKFINGAFEGLKYTLSAIVGGEVGKANFYNVGDALTGLDKNVQDVNQRLTNVSNEFNQKIEDFSKDALLWDDEEEAFVARHEKDGKKTNSKLKYLLDGEIAQGSTDAITGNQLYSMNNQLANYFGGGAKYENGKWTDPTFKIVQVNADGTTVETEHHNVADAFGDVNKNMSNINNRIDDVINKVDSDALKWNDKEKAYDAGRDGKPNKIINVADGKVEKGSKDAVNGGQLWETNERVTGVEKDVKHLTNRVDTISNTIADIGDTVINIDAKVDNINNRVDGIEEDAVRYDRDENGKKTNKITLAGGDASEPVLIDNVADGKIEKGSKEAVNGGQLHDYTKEQMKIILDESKQYTDQRVNNIVIDAIDDAVDRAKQYTDMKFDILNYSIESVKKEARQAAAIGLAVSNLRYNDTPGKLSVGFGTGLWRSQSAFAFGAGYTSENGKYRSNISATTSGGHWGVGAGFNMTLN